MINAWLTLGVYFFCWNEYKKKKADRKIRLNKLLRSPVASQAVLRMSSFLNFSRY